MAQTMEFWLAHLSAIAAEGIGIKAYADREGLSAGSLYNWRKRIKDAEASEAGPPQHNERPPKPFVALRLSEPTQTSSCTVVVAPGIRLEFAQPPSPTWVAALSAALQQRAA